MKLEREKHHVDCALFSASFDAPINVRAHDGMSAREHNFQEDKGWGLELRLNVIGLPVVLVWSARLVQRDKTTPEAVGVEVPWGRVVQYKPCEVVPVPVETRGKKSGEDHGQRAQVAAGQLPVP